MDNMIQYTEFSETFLLSTLDVFLSFVINFSDNHKQPNTMASFFTINHKKFLQSYIKITERFVIEYTKLSLFNNKQFCD